MRGYHDSSILSIDIGYQQGLADRREVIDRAAAWAFSVYDQVYARLRDSHRAAQTARKLYNKLLEQAGIR